MTLQAVRLLLNEAFPSIQSSMVKVRVAKVARESQSIRCIYVEIGMLCTLASNGKWRVPVAGPWPFATTARERWTVPLGCYSTRTAPTLKKKADAGHMHVYTRSDSQDDAPFTPRSNHR